MSISTGRSRDHEAAHQSIDGAKFAQWTAAAHPLLSVDENGRNLYHMKFAAQLRWTLP